MSANETLPLRENILGSRKTSGYLIMVLSILAIIWLVSKMNTPSDIAVAALYMTAVGGFFTMGGQTLVDSLAKWKGEGPKSSTSEMIKVERTTEVASRPAE